MIQGYDVTITHDEDKRSIVITQQVTLTDDEVIKYLKLDEILRSAQDNEFDDLLCDYGWSYSDDVLTTFNWLSLDEVLREAQRIVNAR